MPLPDETYQIPAPFPEWAVPGKEPEDKFFVLGEQPRPKWLNWLMSQIYGMQNGFVTLFRRSALGHPFSWRELTTMSDTLTGIAPSPKAIPTFSDEIGWEFRGDVVGQEGVVEELFFSGPVALDKGMVEFFCRTPATTGTFRIGASLTPLIEGATEGTPIAGGVTIDVSSTDYAWTRGFIEFSGFPAQGLIGKLRLFRDRWSAEDTIADNGFPVYLVAGRLF